MKYLERLVICLALVGFLAVNSQAQSVPTRPACLEKSGDMLAGNPKNGINDVGDIYVWKDAVNIYVEYVILDPTPENPLDNWYITATQVEVASDPLLIPQSKGNPVPGRFTYKMEHDYVTGYIEIIPLRPGLYDMVAVAAHADVCRGGLDGIAAALPDYLEVRISNTYSPRQAYFSLVEVRNDTWLNGEHFNEGFCIDRGHGILAEWGWLPAKAYSSYDLPLPPGYEGEPLVDRPENLDLVNWMMNQNFIGKPCLAPDGSDLGLGLIDWYDLQVAIWKLLDDETEWVTTSPINVPRVQYLMDRAAMHDGYIPICNEMLWVLIAPYWPENSMQCQTFIIPVPIPCQTCETAWAGEVLGAKAYQYLFPGKNWATYLLVTPLSSCP